MDKNRINQLIKHLDILDEKEDELNYDRLDTLEELNELEPNEQTWKTAIISLKERMGIE